MIFKLFIVSLILALSLVATAQDNKDWVLPIGGDTIHCDIYKSKNKKLLYKISGGSSLSLAFNKLDTCRRPHGPSLMPLLSLISFAPEASGTSEIGPC